MCEIGGLQLALFELDFLIRESHLKLHTLFVKRNFPAS